MAIRVYVERIGRSNDGWEEGREHIQQWKNLQHDENCVHLKVVDTRNSKSSVEGVLDENGVVEHLSLRSANNTIDIRRTPK